MPALPTERLRLGPGFQDQFHPLIGALSGFLGIEVVGQRFIGCAAQQSDDQAPAGHGVEHRQLLGQADRIGVRNDRAEQGDLDLVNPRREVSGGHRRRGGQDARGIMMLRQADPVEAELFDQRDALHHAAINIGAGVDVVNAGGHRPNTRHRVGRSVAAGFEI